ncbi:MAG: hypothetical protein VX185_08865 [Pseudomonadota bacterium]|nr:hypothetical protein [Pseudomonadota bacterium]
MTIQNTILRNSKNFSYGLNAISVGSQKLNTINQCRSAIQLGSKSSVTPGDIRSYNTSNVDVGKVKTNFPKPFVFKNNERNSIIELFSQITVNPYKNYQDFNAEVKSILQRPELQRFTEACDKYNQTPKIDQPIFYATNCPVDRELPVLGFDNPVQAKRDNKSTFVAEAFLLAYALAASQEPIGYINVNEGDIFQDIKPLKGMENTQSQKALNTINFHKDLANHFVRPDWVNILGIVGDPRNNILTTFVDNKTLLSILPEHVINELQQKSYHTPFDDLTVLKGSKKLGEADVHPIIGGKGPSDIRFFENRTKGLTPQSQDAINQLTNALHTLKVGINIQPGVFVGAANNECTHGKEVIEIKDKESAKERWLMKTVNVESLEEHKKYILNGQERIING